MAGERWGGRRSWKARSASSRRGAREVSRSRRGHCTTKNTNKLAVGSFYKNKTLKEEKKTRSRGSIFHNFKHPPLLLVYMFSSSIIFLLTLILR